MPTEGSAPRRDEPDPDVAPGDAAVPEDRSPEPGTADAASVEEPSADHQEGGLELARAIARSLARRPATGTRRSGSGRGAAGRWRSTSSGRAGASGAHPDDRDPQTLDATLGRLIAEQGWSTQARVQGVFARWGALVGREVAEHCTPERFEDGRLSVRTDSTAWATQVRLLAPQLLARLNAELGDGTVTFLEVHGPRSPSWTRGPRRVRGRGPRDTYG